MGKSLQWDYPILSWDNEIEMGGVSSELDIYIYMRDVLKFTVKKVLEEVLRETKRKR